MLIGVGMPISTGSGVCVGMVWFSPGDARRLYAKQQLHADELPYFVAGGKQLVLEREDSGLCLLSATSRFK